MATKSLFVMAVACALVAVVYGQAEGTRAGNQLSQTCLGCICDATSGCNTAAGCNGDICGPFHITWAYWADAGKPTLNNEWADDNAYGRCTSDAYCSARAVQGYMDKYAQDCNGDGVINCDDYMRIHILGGNGCRNGNLQEKYSNVYTNCRNRFPAGL